MVQQQCDEKQPIIARFFIWSIKGFSNHFWHVMDTWSYKNPRIARHYNDAIADEYKAEYKSFGIPENSTILHIGCGPYPLTVVELALLGNVMIVGIDKNPLAVQQAREVIERKGLTNKVTIDQGDGSTYPVESFDVIIVSSCSYPKSHILEHLFTTAKPNAIIIVRELRVASKIVDRCIEKYPSISIIKRMSHYSNLLMVPFIWVAFYLKKTE
jgi:16S rRNA A1518/A1519 N6-dimethyltransferase RsmA/KsgA/DIM1 with predicted DNA glycosylase/AP lyase activity